MIAELSRAEGPLAELHTHRAMSVIFHSHGYRNVEREQSRAGLARGHVRRRAGLARGRVRCLVFKTVVSSYWSSSTHLKY